MHHVRGRLGGDRGELELFDDLVIVGGERLHRRLCLHEHDPVAVDLELLEQFGAASAVARWKSCIRTMPLPFFFNLVSTEVMTWSGLRILKSKESMSVEKMAMLRSPR